MAAIRVEYTWASGDSVNTYMESDLESTAELREQAALLWGDMWGSLDSADADGRAATPDA